MSLRRWAQVNRIDKQINELMTILQKQDWKTIDFETIGTISIKFTLYSPKYESIKKREFVQLCDSITDKRVIIDMVVATEIIINEEKQEYEIQLDNDQHIKMKLY